MRKKLIVLSLKGTLLLSDDDTINVWRRALKKHGLSPDELIIYEFYGEDFEEVVLPKMIDKYAWTKSQVEAVITEAKQTFKEINKSINGYLAEQLASLKKQDYSLGIMSNRKLSEVEIGLAKIKCSLELFDFVKTAENGAHKPDPKAFDIMFSNFNPEEIVFVGSDPNKDWPVARALGIEFVAITTPSTLGFWQSAGVSMGVKRENIFLNVPAYLDRLLSE